MRWLPCVFLCFAAPCFGWSAKEHIQFTRLAAERLIARDDTPPAMKDWLRQAIPNLLDREGEKSFLLHAHVGSNPQATRASVLFWAVEPDRRAQNDPRDVRRQPFDQPERLMHFIDVELFLTGNRQRAFADDLSAKPPIENFRRDWRDERYIQAGYLPFAVEDAYQNLVKAIRENRLMTTIDPATNPAVAATQASGGAAGGADDQSAVRWAGYLAHYAQDNTQPQHATIDFKSQSYFKVKRTAPNVHSEMEWRLVDDERNEFPALRSAYWELFQAALDAPAAPTSGDVWHDTLEISLKSYDALPLIGHAATASATAAVDDRPSILDTEKFFGFRGAVDGVDTSVLELKARQTALAVKRTEQLWLAAWREATHAPAKPIAK